jgi:NAD(P)-dependent dehydrogenase (short-subunit alcohol dehydrogenase family)
LALAIDLSGRVAIVTGGARGVGRGIAKRLLEAGAQVVICGRNEPESSPEGGGRKALFLPCDVRDAEQVAALVSDTVARLGRLDVLVNNAGGAPAAEAATASPRFHEKIIALNLTAGLHCAQAANAVMQKQDSGGVILSITSVSALRPSPGTAAYGAAKAGLISLTQSLAVEWAPKVRLATIAGDESSIQRVGAGVPLGRLAEPEDVGDACAFLASPLASYISGATLLLHGGGERPAFLSAVEK